MVDKLTFDALRQQKLDIYEALEINELATDAQVRKAYRKQALKYHPDKNPTEDAKDKFRFISQVYDFLINNKEERQKYDNYLAELRQQDQQVLQANKSVQEKRRQLEQLEREFAEQDREDAMQRHVIQQLRQQGARKKYDLEKSLLGETMKRLSSCSNILIDDDVKTAEITWKIQNKMQSLFTEQVVGRLMGVFGAVKTCTMLPCKTNGENHAYVYGKALVVFESLLAIAKIIDFDIAADFHIWNHAVGKSIGKLVRSVKWALRKVDVRRCRSSVSFYNYLIGLDSAGSKSNSQLPRPPLGLLLNDYKDMTLLRLNVLKE